MRVTIFSLIIIFLFSCKDQKEKNCYPNEQVAKIVVLVADTTILGRDFIPENDTVKTCPVFNGIGFVKLTGTSVHRPLKEVALSQSQQNEFLKILRPLPPQYEGTVTDCIPYFRHVVLIYGKAHNLIGQMHICFDCRQVKFNPEPACLDFFDNNRMSELKRFFEENSIPLFAEN